MSGLKKNLSNSASDKKQLIDPFEEKISIRRQCLLLGVSRSSVYYSAHHPQNDSPSDKKLMDRIDNQYSKTPFYGTRKMAKRLSSKKNPINRKRVQRLMRKMGISAIYQRPNTSKANKHHKKFPYLLRGLIINQPNQVWATDITYVRLKKGFAYLVVIIDWYSRRVLSWKLSNTLDSIFCIDALTEAIELYGAPTYFNTDQGSQFTSNDFTKVLEDNNIKISMDGKGRAIDNVFTERLWRTVKYEDIFLRGYETMTEAQQGLCDYFLFYNSERIHEKLDYKTPDLVYYEKYRSESIAINKNLLKEAV